MKQASADMVLAPLRSVLLDVARWKPELKTPSFCSLERLQRILETRGPSIVLLDFAEAGKLFDLSLSRGELNTSALPVSMGSWHTRRFLFYDLFLEVMDAQGRVDDPADETAVFFCRQVLYLFKKLKVDCPETAVIDALDDFKSIDDSLRSPTLPWMSGPEEFKEQLAGQRLSFYSSLLREDIGVTLFPEVGVTFHPTLGKGVAILDAVCRHVISNMPVVSVEDFYPKHGPGAVSDLRTGDDKYSFPVWPSRLDYFFPIEYFSMYNEEAFKDYSVLSATNLSEPKGRVLAVPKTFKGPRLITAEPTALQYAQQGVLGWLRKHLPQPLSQCLDFRSQTASRDAALTASRTGGMATVDLSSASDRLSLWTVERVFQYSGILPYLYASRCLWVTNGTGIDGSLLGPTVLRKYAGQGNATTFPVQSIVYSICCIAAVLTAAGCKPTKKNISLAAGKVRVFGDDLIVPTSAVPILDLILGFLQLKINASKTHMSGKFRESCGMDAYNGADVTPLYLSYLSPGDSPDTQTSWVDVLNNAHLKGLWELSSYMEGQLPPKLRKLIPTSSGDLGCISLRTFCPGSPTFSRVRFNRELQRKEGLGLVPLPKVRTAQREGSNGLTAYLSSQATRTVHPLDYLALKKGGGANSIITSSTAILRRGWVPFE